MKICHRFSNIGDFIYPKVANSNTSCLEAQADFFRLYRKGIFDPYVLSTLDTGSYLHSRSTAQGLFSIKEPFDSPTLTACLQQSSPICTVTF